MDITQVHFDQFLCIFDADYEDWEGYIIRDHVSIQEIEDKVYYKIRHPDIIAYHKGEMFIIEIDGAAHRKDLDYDTDYQDLDISHIKLNKEYMQKTGTPWDVYIRQQLCDIGVLPEGTEDDTTGEADS